MKDNKNKPVQVVLTYNAHSAKNNLQATVMNNRQHQAEETYIKLDDNHKLVRRYSIDDNGGGYRGL